VSALPLMYELSTDLPFDSAGHWDRAPETSTCCNILALVSPHATDFSVISRFARREGSSSGAPSWHPVSWCGATAWTASILLCRTLRPERTDDVDLSETRALRLSSANDARRWTCSCIAASQRRRFALLPLHRYLRAGLARLDQLYPFLARQQSAASSSTPPQRTLRPRFASLSP
jgi:hypothetical protein